MGEELGDCVLHADHHPLAGECYEEISRRFARYLLVHDLTYSEARDAYALDYEAAVLDALLP